MSPRGISKIDKDVVFLVAGLVKRNYIEVRRPGPDTPPPCRGFTMVLLIQMYSTSEARTSLPWGPCPEAPYVLGGGVLEVDTL